MTEPDSQVDRQGMNRLLRLEGVAIGVLAIFVYTRGDHSWLAFALLFLVPDLSMLGYIAGPRLGALTYNIVHTYVGPMILAAVMLLTGGSMMLPLIWIAHIGLDRALGYRLENVGVRGRQIRHRAIALHLHHDRPYRDAEVVRRNREILQRIERSSEYRARRGIAELGPDPSLQIT